ncbi:MAG: class I SAM-dependent methyltransferase [Chlorobi bacterium]|nr:class I SAM-dependent methyltransferase [Chlorobiota bacterium]
MPKTKPFDEHLKEYEEWFDSNHFVYLSELEAVKQLLPAKGRGIEVGIGSGLFAEPLEIKEGCDPSAEMRGKAQKRGLKVKECVAENLPYENNSVDYVLMVTTICFVDDPQKTFEEINRILNPGGLVVVAFVDKDSPVGKIYLENKDKSMFYKEATFFGTDEIIELLQKTGFTTDRIVQTVFGLLNEVKEVQQPKEGYGEGSFVVLKGIKN